MALFQFPLTTERERKPEPPQPKPIALQPTGIGTAKQPARSEDEAFWEVDEARVLNSGPQHVYEMRIDVFFNARHAVVTQGRRGPVHAHAYRLEVVFRTHQLSAGESLMVGYADLRRQVVRVAQAYNNHLLNDLPPFQNSRLQPSTEALAGIMYQQVERLVKNLPVTLMQVIVRESPTESVAYVCQQPPLYLATLASDDESA
ncbi:MAG: hypothetical protein OHK0052_27000 [Anaerolineales bacterium]